MAQCPFCNSSIDDDLERFGGSCPRCFIEIPGYETPTDPGAQLQAARELEAAREGKKRSVATLIVVMVSVMGLTGAAVFYNVRASALQQAAVSDMADVDFYISPIEDLPISATRKESSNADPDRDSTGKPSYSSASAHQASHDGTGSGHVAGTAAQARTSSRPVYDFRNSLDSTPLETGFKEEVATFKPDIVSGGASLTIDHHSVPALVLTSAQEIRESVRIALQAYNGQIRNCYDKRLLETPSLKGVWELRFTINTDGTTGDVSVIPSGTQDSRLESCMKRQTARWTFQPLARPQSIEIPYKLGVSG